MILRSTDGSFTKRLIEKRHFLIGWFPPYLLGHESEDSMSTLAGRRGMRPKMMMPFDSQPPQRKCVCVSDE